MTKLVVIERKTGKETFATRTEEGKFTIEGGKTYSASTFKKYYKLTGEIKPEKTAKAAKKLAKNTVKVIYMTFTGMVIGKDTFGEAVYEATVTKTGYTMETKRHGVQKFDKNGIQLECKNPKFANRIVLVEA